MAAVAVPPFARGVTFAVRPSPIRMPKAAAPPPKRLPELPSDAIYGDLSPSKFCGATVSACTKMGRRKYQEDKIVIASRLRHDSVLFAGVFDGTVGDHASAFVQGQIVEAIHSSKHFEAAVAVDPTFASIEASVALHACMHEAFATTDADLLRHCAAHGHHYASSTAATVLMTGDLLTIAHLGDSKVVLGKEILGLLCTRALTLDHKPDMPVESRRIEASGGSIEYLHGGKPFLRGGDFFQRQRAGDRPMQLNYARAFGGKDLKPYGLICTPTVMQVKIGRSDKILIVASDGVWDVMTTEVAVRCAWEAHRQGRNPAAVLTDFALLHHDLKGSIDNVSVIVIVF